jgi:Mycothiol maleylpyruvate isomerase N-terminal domain
MDPGIVEANRASRSWLRATVERLSEDDMTRPITEGWTAAGLLAHMAFWDRFCRARWLHAQGANTPTPLPLDDALLELINAADQAHWTKVPPRLAVEECLEAADTLDTLIQSLGDEVAVKIEAEGRPRLINRSIHRQEHLSTIEAAFPIGA